MEISIKRNALKEFINKALRENRTHHSAEINQIPAKEDDDTPLEPSPQVAIQLSTERPPVEDAHFIPATHEELALSAGVLAREVPTDQIEYFYRMLHKLLDKTLDRYDRNQFESLQEVINIIIEQDDDDDDEPDDSIAEGFYTSMFITILDNKELFLPSGVVATTGRIDDTPENRSDMKIKMFNFLSNHVDFRDMNINDPGLRNARKRAVQDAIDHFLYRSPPQTEKEKAELAKAAKTGVIERAELKAKQSAIKSAVDLWDTNQGDLDAISTELEEMIVSVSGSPEEIYLQHVLDTIEHISVEYSDSVDKSKFKNAIKAVILSDDLSPANADEVFELADDDVTAQKSAKAVQKRKKSEDQRVWANIASVAGFSGPSGAKQYTRPAMLKVMMHTTGVFSEDNRRIAMSRSSRAFRSSIINLVDQGKMDPVEGRTLMSTAHPNVKGNELFRIFVKEYFWQPFINLFDKIWKAKASEFYILAGVLESVAKSDTFVRLAVGETNWDSDTAKKKIESVMSLKDFKKVRSQTQNFVRAPENIQFWNKFAKDFINQISGIYIGDDPKAARKAKIRADKLANDTLATVLRDKKGELAYVEREREA